MTDWTPGDGWRKLRPGERDQDEMIVHYGSEGSTSWVRVPPVPSLPIEPYTVIRVTWKEGLRPDARELVRWSATWESEDNLLTPEELANRITGFEVLAEPRAGAVKRAEESARRLTAKAVLDRVRRHYRRGSLNDTRLAAIAREFGVSS